MWRKCDREKCEKENKVLFIGGSDKIGQVWQLILYQTLLLGVCEMVLWSSALFNVQTHEGDQQHGWKMQWHFFLLKMTAAQTRAVMACLLGSPLAQLTLESITSPTGWWDEDERWLKGSHTFCTSWRHEAGQILGSDWDSLNWVYMLTLFIVSYLPYLSFTKCFLEFPAKGVNLNSCLLGLLHSGDTKRSVFCSKQDFMSLNCM